MDPEYGVAQQLANDARRAKTWGEVEKARLTGSGLSEQAEFRTDASNEAGEQLP